MKQYILQRPVVRKSVSFPGLTKNSNQTAQQLVYTLGNISSIVLSGLLSDDVGPTDFIVHWIQLPYLSKMKPELMNFRGPNSKELIHHANPQKVLFA